MNVEMHDMAETYDAQSITKPTDKKEKHYPTTHISSKKLPGIGEYEVGDTCKIISENVITGINVLQDKTVEVRLEIRKMGIVEEGEKKKMKEMGVDKKQFSKLKEKGMI